MGRLEKQKRQLIEEANKRILNEGWFSRKKEIKSFTDYNDYIKGIDTTVTVYQKGDKFLVTRRGHEEYVIKTFDNVEDALRFASDMTNEEKFRTEPEHFTYEDLPYDDNDVYTLNEETNTIEDCKKQILNDIYEDNLYNLEVFCINYFKKPTNIDMGLVDRMLKWLKDKKPLYFYRGLNIF